MLEGDARGIGYVVEDEFSLSSSNRWIVHEDYLVLGRSVESMRTGSPGKLECGVDLMEFTHNKNFHASIGMTSYRACMGEDAKHIYIDFRTEKQFRWFRSCCSG